MIGTSRSTFPRPTRTTLSAFGLSLGLLALAGVGCAKEDPTTNASGNVVKVVLTDAGCKPDPVEVGGGETSFVVTNEGANGVSEAELKAEDGQSILGERENISPGLSGTFKLKLGEGTYKMYCPGAKQDTWTFTVEGGEKVGNWRENPALVKAIDAYGVYVNGQASQLVTDVAAFAKTVKSGDVEAAKRAYVTARLPYERIEPVAESFGDLDPRIDGRLGDNGNGPDDFIGFHRIEKAIWVDGNLTGMGPIADGLVADVGKLKTRIAAKSKTYEPNEVTNGALELITEVLTGKITGEEERYSHIDLVDFQANFDGSMKIIDLLRPVLKQSAPDLLAKIDKASARVQDELDELKANPGYVDTGFIEWSCAGDSAGLLPEGCAVTKTAAVTTTQRRALTDAVKPLAALLSEVPVKVLR